MTTQEYINTCPEIQITTLLQIIQIIDEHISSWFEKCMNYKMLGRVVPHSIYPNGYHCNPSLPLPFLNLAYRKSSINLYHMWMYANQALLEWFKSEYPKHCSKKLDMGKSCIRFKYYDEIPYELIRELVRKMSVEEWIAVYKKSYITV